MGEIDNGGLFNHKPLDETPMSTALTNLTGRQVGRYLVQRQLGSGGVAVVYQAYDQVQGISVALKVLLPGADEKTHGRFRREALTAGALRHPNIVRILQVGTALQGEIAYIAMELIEGETLGELLSSRGRLRPEESCNLLEPIARALAFAHQQGFIHRDVKPSNILLRPTGPGAPDTVQLETLDYPVTPLLSDFGIARSMDAPELTSTGRTVGTPAYMAPEQCAGQRGADGRADIYSLGAVLYRCVVGHTPFSGSTTQILHAHVYEPLTIDDDVLSVLPYSVVTILQRSLAKKAEDRYATAEEMANALARAAGRVVPRAPTLQNLTSASSEATGTLALPSLPVEAQPPTHATTILVPAPSGPPTARTLQSTPLTAASPGRPPVRSRTVALPTLFTGLGLMVLGLIFIGTIAWFVYNNRLGNLPFLSTPTPQSQLVITTSTNTPTVAPPTATIRPEQNGGDKNNNDAGTLTAIAVQPTAVVVIAPTPLATATFAPTVIAPTETPLPLPSPTDTPLPTDTPAPSATWTPLPSPTVVVTATATMTPTATLTPTVEPTEMVCPTVIDGHFLGYIGDQPAAIQGQLKCAQYTATEPHARLLPFEHGFILLLEESSEFYVMYGQEWIQEEADWQSDADPATTPLPGQDNFYQPVGAWEKIWKKHKGQDRLGYAIQPDPIRFDAVKQQFVDDSVLIANKNGGQVYPFLGANRSK
ncbi:MAG: protein kinase [Chloroflexi bacterium]|nr:protein kinase [Chloroflexota bacterium]